MSFTYSERSELVISTNPLQVIYLPSYTSHNLFYSAPILNISCKSLILLLMSLLNMLHWLLIVSCFLWVQKEDKYYQIVLMLIYSGVRISELLDLKKENVHLDEQYFDVICSKTENGIRKVPIADKVLPYYKAWYESCPECEYLLHTEDGKHFEYRNYYDSYFKPLMEQLNINRTPHCCRHTCISMLAEAGINQTIIKKIVGHSGAMTLTENCNSKTLFHTKRKLSGSFLACFRQPDDLQHFVNPLICQP